MARQHRQDVTKLVRMFFERGFAPYYAGFNYFVIKTSTLGDKVYLQRCLYNGMSYNAKIFEKDALEEENFERTIRIAQAEMSKYKEEGQKKLDPLYCERPFWMPANWRKSNSPSTTRKLITSIVDENFNSKGECFILAQHEYFGVHLIRICYPDDHIQNITSFLVDALSKENFEETVKRSYELVQKYKSRGQNIPFYVTRPLWMDSSDDDLYCLVPIKDLLSYTSSMAD